jgi:hypothetical protein
VGNYSSRKRRKILWKLGWEVGTNASVIFMKISSTQAKILRVMHIGRRVVQFFAGDAFFIIS